jgi:hypothetical protein
MGTNQTGGGFWLALLWFAAECSKIQSRREWNATHRFNPTQREFPGTAPRSPLSKPYNPAASHTHMKGPPPLTPT